MPPEAYALVTMFAISSIVLGFVAVRIVAIVGAPTSWAAYILPILAAFGSLYYVGHRMGLRVGPEVELFGFQVALLGDWLVGFVAAFATTLVQALVVSLTRNRRGA